MLQVGECYLISQNIQSIPRGAIILVVEATSALPGVTGQYKFLYNEQITSYTYWSGSAVDKSPNLFFRRVS